jgi:thiamine-phosphate pyrophosphorylase
VTSPRLIVITDPAYSDDAMIDTIERMAKVLPPGVLCVQLRDKTRPVVSLRVLASRLRILTKQHGAMLVVNGDAKLAKDVGADGVHLGGGAMSIAKARGVCGEHAWVSIAAHSDDAVRAAVKEGANAALVSPIFPTTSKVTVMHSETRVRVPKERDGDEEKMPRGLDAISSARAIAGAGKGVAIYALGGVSLGNVRRCVEAGADGVAVIRALLASEDPAKDAVAFAAALIT